jgi:hypothetical protein
MHAKLKAMSWRHFHFFSRCCLFCVINIFHVFVVSEPILIFSRSLVLLPSIFFSDPYTRGPHVWFMDLVVTQWDLGYQYISSIAFGWSIGFHPSIDQELLIPFGTERVFFIQWWKLMHVNLGAICSTYLLVPNLRAPLIHRIGKNVEIENVLD